MEDSLLIAIVKEALTADNFKSTANKLIKRHNLDIRVDIFRKTLSNIAYIAGRDDISPESLLTLTKQTRDGEGNIISEVYKDMPDRGIEVDYSKMQLTHLTTNPNGEDWYRFKVPEMGWFGDAYIEKLADILRQSIEPVQIIDTGQGKKVLCVYTSDKHIGAHVPEDAMYPNNYSKEEYKRRMQTVLQQVILASSIHGRFHKIVVFDLGDAMDGLNGETTRGGHKLPQNLSSEEQFDTYHEVEKWWWDSLISYNVGDTYQFVAASNSNHGGTFDYTAYRCLETYLNIKYPKIETFVAKRFVDHVEAEDHTIIFTHGKDKEHRKKGFPLRLDKSTIEWFNDYILHRQLRGTIRVCKGDLHQYNCDPSKLFYYNNVPSIFGSSGWIMANFGQGRPGAYFEVFTPGDPNVIQMPYVLV